MATAEPEKMSPEEKASSLNDFLKARKNEDSKPAIVEDSQTKAAALQRAPSADADCLSREKKAQKLNDFLKKKNMKRHRRRKRRLTVNDVKAETARILEEFLQTQLEQQEVQTTSPEHRYQRYVESNITEETSPSPSSSGYLASTSGILRENSIPYADADSDNELTKAESLPHEDFMEKYFGRASDKGLEIHHSKSKSAPYSGNDDDTYFIQPKSTRYKPPPPPPPGTPHTPSEQGSNELISLPVPYQGVTTDSSHQDVTTDSSIPFSTDTKSLDTHLDHPRKSTPPKVPTTLDLPKPIDRPKSSESHEFPASSESRSHSSSSKASTLPNKRRKKSRFASSESGEDSSDHGNSHLSGRKKKSVFKKAQERLQTFLRLSRHHSPESELSERIDAPQKVVKKKRKQKKKHGDDFADASPKGHQQEVLEEKHVHTKKHVHQTHIGEDGKGTYRTEHITEVVDVDSKSGKKHIKKEWKVKESTDSDKGFIGRIRRLTSRSDKRHIKGSKSMNLPKEGQEPPDYNRALSYHDHRGGVESSDHHVRVNDSDGFSVTEIERSASGNKEEIHASQVVSRREGDVKRHSSHLDIVDHTGAMVDRVYFDPDDATFPRNMSFDYEVESYVHERRVREDGKIRVIKDMNTHDHMSIDEADDVEADGHSDDQKDLSQMSEMEKEELYGKIAERLAMIGDHLQVERETELARKAASSPGFKLSTASGGKELSPDSEIKKTTLTQLETEIRDELRMVADDIDARLTAPGPRLLLAADARQAAMRIAGMVTYNHFKNVVQDTVGNEVGWAQVAAVFNITKRAIQLAGASGALAVQIKEISLRYIEDRFANWIVAKGGWDSMLSDNSEDEEDDEEYSDLD